MSADKCMTVVMPLLIVLLFLLPPQLRTDVLPIVSNSRTEQQDEAIALDSLFEPFKKTSSNFEDLQFGHQDSHRQTGFILPSSLRTLYIQGPALARCKSACRLVLTMMKKTDEIVSVIGSSQTTSCSLKSLMIFPGLKAGKYQLTTICHDEEQSCYTDPVEKFFEVAINDDRATEVVHLGSLMTFMRQRNITEEQNFDVNNMKPYDSTKDEEQHKYWRTFIGVWVICSLVAVGLALISHCTAKEKR